MSDSATLDYLRQAQQRFAAFEALGRTTGTETLRNLERLVALCERERLWCQEQITEYPQPTQLGASLLLFRDQVDSVLQAARNMLGGRPTTADTQRLATGLYMLARVVDDGAANAIGTSIGELSEVLRQSGDLESYPTAVSITRELRRRGAEIVTREDLVQAIRDGIGAPDRDAQAMAEAVMQRLSRRSSD